MEGLLRVSAMIDRINTWIGRSAMWLILLAVLVSTVNAIIRKAFDISSNAWLELQWKLFGAVFLLCAAWTLPEEGAYPHRHRQQRASPRRARLDRPGRPLSCS